MPTAEELKNLGNHAFANKEYKRAAKIYRDAIKLDSNNPILYSNRAICFIKLEDWERALKDCESGINLRPNISTKVKLYYRMGLVYKGLKRNEDAISSFQNVLKLDSNNLATKKELDQIFDMSSQKKKIKLDSSKSIDIPIKVVEELPKFFQSLNNGNVLLKSKENTNIKKSDAPKEEIDKEIKEKLEIKMTNLNSKTIKNSEKRNIEVSENGSTLNLLSSLKSIPEVKKTDAYKYVLEINPLEYSKMFSSSVLELEFMEFFLEASCYVSKNNSIQNWPSIILNLLQEFSKTPRFSLTLDLCSKCKIDNLLNEVKNLGDNNIYSNYRAILEN